MALTVHKPEHEEPAVKPVILQQRTYITAQGRAVPAGNPGAAFLLGPVGGTISGEAAKRAGVRADGTLSESPGAKAEAPDGDKAVHGPPQDKAAGKKRASKKRAGRRA